MARASMKKYVIAGLAGIGLMMASASFAQQVKNADQRFSFKGKRTTFKERDVDNIEVVVSSADSEGRISVIESDWLPEFQVEPHYHKRHAETFYIISGNVEWTIGGETHVMGLGDAVHIPPNTVHSVKVVGGKKMHSLMIAEPGGYEEDSVYASSLRPSSGRTRRSSPNWTRRSITIRWREIRGTSRRNERPANIFRLQGSARHTPAAMLKREKSWFRRTTAKARSAWWNRIGCPVFGTVTLSQDALRNFLYFSRGTWSGRLAGKPM